MKKLILATGNRNKAREIGHMLEGQGIQVLTMKEAGLNPEIEENGATFRENALIKARTVYAALKEAGLADKDTAVLSDDSGFEVEALGGEPGVYSARYLGEDTPYEVKMAALLERLKAVKGAARKADFRAVIAVIFPGDREETAEGVFEGLVAQAPAGQNGFGYDPILYVPEKGCTCAELAEEEKNQMSHRGKALGAVKPLLLAWAKEKD